MKTLNHKITEALQQFDDNQLIKFAGTYHGTNRFPENGKQTITAIPGYAATLADMKKVFGPQQNHSPKNGEEWDISVPYDGNMYKVHIDRTQLLPVPFNTHIVGYAGPPRNKLTMETINQLLTQTTNIHDAMELATKITRHTWNGLTQFTHDLLRSIEPGVTNNETSPDGWETESIINIPCKMTLIATPHHEDENGYYHYKL